MYPAYYVIDLFCNQEAPAEILPATEPDFRLTVQDGWQTSWMSEYIQDPLLQKFALKITATGELVGLAAYRDMPDGYLIYIEYIESAPHSNPHIGASSKISRYRGSVAGIRGTTFCGLWLWRHHLFESEDLGNSGTLYPGFWCYPVQPRRSFPVAH